MSSSMLDGMPELICIATFRIETRDLRVPCRSGLRLISESAILTCEVNYPDGGNASGSSFDQTKEDDYEPCRLWWVLLL